MLRRGKIAKNRKNAAVAERMENILCRVGRLRKGSLKKRQSSHAPREKSSSVLRGLPWQNAPRSRAGQERYHHGPYPVSYTHLDP